MVPQEDALTLSESHKAHRRDMTYLADKSRELGKLMRTQASTERKVEVATTLDVNALLFEGGPLAERSSKAGKEAKLRMEKTLAAASEQEKADLAFDFLVTPEEARKQKLCAAKGWDANALTPHQQRWLTAVLNGVSSALATIQPGQLAEDGQTLTLGNKVLEKKAQLGKGGFGEVFKFESPDGSGKPLALKVMNASATEAMTQEEARKAIEKELRTHQHLMRGKPNAIGRNHIISLDGVVKDAAGNLNMVMELADGGDMGKNMEAMTYASNAGVLSKETQDILNARQMKQLLEGMIYLRNMGMTHFDMKPANVFMTADGTLKIGDFGSGGISQHESGGQYKDAGAGTHGYQPNYKGIGKDNYAEADVDRRDSSYNAFALGRIMEMMVHHQTQVRQNVSEKSQSVGVLGELLKAMTDPVSTLRPSLEQVLESSHFALANAVPDEELAELQRLTTQYGKTLNRFVKQNQPALLTALGDALGAGERRGLSNETITFTQALDASAQSWEKLARAAQPAVNALYELSAADEQGPGTSQGAQEADPEAQLPPNLEELLTLPRSRRNPRDAYFAELPAEMLADVATAALWLGQPPPKTADALEELFAKAQDSVKKLRNIRLEIANEPEVAAIGKQIKAVEQRIKAFTG